MNPDPQPWLNLFSSGPDHDQEPAQDLAPTPDLGYFTVKQNISVV